MVGNISISGVSKHFINSTGERITALDNVSLKIPSGSFVSLIGPSGCGKSTLLRLISGLIQMDEGELTLDGVPVTAPGADRGFMFQEHTLFPWLSIYDNIAFGLRARGIYKQEKDRVDEFIEMVGLKGFEHSYPHQLSGGQRQRIVIAMALLLKPDLLICDEPTTALDVTTQASILKLILELQKKNGTAVLFITHDFGVVSEIADQVVVLELGKQIETGPAKAVLQHPKEPYTQKLINAVPELKPRHRPPVDGYPTLLEAKNVVKTYTLGGFFTGRVKVRALKGVSARLRRGETIGIVGESGSGKSTFARSIARLIDPTSGEVWVNGENVAAAPKRKLHGLRRRLQVVFQDPYRSLDPRMTVGESIVEGPVNFGVPKEEAWKRAQEFMKIVRLSPDALNRYPNQFSGGQRQRISIARALACEPEILICDEAVSALDVSVQADILKLLEEIQVKLGIGILFVTHDLRVASQICDDVIVIRRGECVESGHVQDVFFHPQHEYTKSLIAAAPGTNYPFGRTAHLF